MRLGFLTDLHWGGTSAAWHNPYDFAGLPARLEAALAWFAAEGVDAVTVTGDLSHDGPSDVLEHLGDALYVRGNHDEPGEMRTQESISGVPVVPEHGWFAARIEPPEPAPVVLSHFPLLSFATAVAEQGLAYPGDAVGRQQALAALLPPVVILSGHIHARASQAAGGVLQLVGGPLIEPPYEAAIVTLEPDRVTRTVRALAGPPARAPFPVLPDAPEWRLDDDGSWRPT